MFRIGDWVEMYRHKNLDDCHRKYSHLKHRITGFTGPMAKIMSENGDEIVPINVTFIYHSSPPGIFEDDDPLFKMELG